MPSLGDVTVGLRADTAQFSAAMRQASTVTAEATATTGGLVLNSTKLSAALDELRRDVALMNAHLKSGVLDAKSYAASMAASRQQVLALGISMHNADAAGVRQFGQLLHDTAPAATKAGLGIKSLREPLTSLAATALGVSGRVGTLGSVLLSVGAGSAVAVGVVAGIAAIATAFSKMGEKAREARAEIKAITDELLVQARERVGEGRAEELAKLYKELGRLQRELNPSRTSYGGIQLVAPMTSMQRAQILADIENVNAAIRELRQQQVDDLPKEKAEQYAGAVKSVRENMEALTRSADEWIRRQHDPILFTISGVMGRRPRSAPPVPEGPDEADANRLTGYLMKGLDPVLKAAERRRHSLLEAGRAIGKILGDGVSRGLARSILGGVKDLADVLKNVFRAALEELLAYLIKATVLKPIAKIIGSALGGGGGGILGGIVEGLTGSLGVSRAEVRHTAAASMQAATIVVPVSAIPRSRSPLEQARDAQWQTLLGETLRVMEGLGYRTQYA